jgi:hypothetical protein
MFNSKRARLFWCVSCVVFVVSSVCLVCVKCMSGVSLVPKNWFNAFIGSQKVDTHGTDSLST